MNLCCSEYNNLIKSKYVVYCSAAIYRYRTLTITDLLILNFIHLRIPKLKSKIINFNRILAGYNEKLSVYY